jgi:hypothetical protein
MPPITAQMLQYDAKFGQFHAFLCYFPHLASFCSVLLRSVHLKRMGVCTVAILAHQKHVVQAPALCVARVVFDFTEMLCPAPSEPSQPK